MMKNIKSFGELSEGQSSVGRQTKKGFNFASLSSGQWITDGKTKVKIDGVGVDHLTGKSSDGKSVNIRDLKGWSLVNEAKKVDLSKLNGFVSPDGRRKNQVVKGLEPMGTAHEKLPKRKDRMRDGLIEDLLYILNDTLKPGADRGSTQAVINTKDIKKAAGKIADFIGKMNQE
jgi:hypothetical protein